MEAKPFQLFSGKSKPPLKAVNSTLQPLASTKKIAYVDHGDPDADTSSIVGFTDLGLFKWAGDTYLELEMRRPTPVQRNCIPRILAGDDVMEPYGVFALVLTPTRELACQLAEQFRVLGSSPELRCTLIVSGFDMISQARALVLRPHVVVATSGRIKALLSEDSDIPAVFSKTKVISLVSKI